MPPAVRTLARLGACSLALLACSVGDASEQASPCTEPITSDGAAPACPPADTGVAVAASDPPVPPPAPDQSLRPAVVAMLGALVDSVLPARPIAAAPRLACLASDPLPPRESRNERSEVHDTYDPRLRFLADPDAALLATLQRPGVLLFHPRRCPPTLEQSVHSADARPRTPPPPGEDPTYLSVRELMIEPNGALYADMAVARGARGEFWICAVLRDDLTTARCTATARTWKE